MKKLLVVAAALVIASNAMAQLLPVAQTAEKSTVGDISATAGLQIWTGDADLTIFGARCSYGVAENMLLIGDLAMADAGDSNIGIGVAGQYSLSMLKLPMDLAVRLGYGTYDIGELSDAGFIELMVLASKKLESVDLAVYGGIGLLYPMASGSDVSALIDVGVKYALPVENLSIFGELTFSTESVMGLGIGAGAVYAF